MKPFDRKYFTHRNLAFVFLLGLVVACSTTGITTAATIFESGTLGPTGIHWEDLTDQTVPGTHVSPDVYIGARFELTQPVVTSRVGGHFASPSGGTFFGAIVSLADENDFPDSGDFSTNDFIGSTELAFPVSSDEVFGDLSLSLDPGWYALIFGSGLFDAAGGGGAVRNGTDLGSPTYIGFQPGNPGWRNRTRPGSNERFVVNGQIVPEAARQS